MGYNRKDLEKSLSEIYGLGGGCPEPHFSENWPLPLTVLGGLLPVLVRFQTDCTAPLPPLLGALLGGWKYRPPPYLWGEKFKKKNMFRRRLV